MIVEEDREAIAHIVNLFYRLAGGTERCSTSAVGALRQELPLYATFEASLMNDLCNRIANAFPQMRGSALAAPATRAQRSFALKRS